MIFKNFVVFVSFPCHFTSFAFLVSVVDSWRDFPIRLAAAQVHDNPQPKKKIEKYWFLSLLHLNIYCLTTLCDFRKCLHNSDRVDSGKVWRLKDNMLHKFWLLRLSLSLSELNVRNFPAFCYKTTRRWCSSSLNIYILVFFLLLCCENAFRIALPNIIIAAHTKAQPNRMKRSRCLSLFRYDIMTSRHNSSEWDKASWKAEKVNKQPRSISFSSR